MDIKDVPEGEIIKIDANKLGQFYILGGLNPNRQYIHSWFKEMAKGEKNPNIGKHYYLQWVDIEDYCIVYHHSTDGKGIFTNLKGEFVELTDILRGRLGLAFSSRYLNYRFQPDDTKYYKIVLSFQNIYRTITSCLKTKRNIKTIESLKEYDRLVKEYPYYRGQTSYNYQMLPGIYRGDYLSKEKDLYNDFVKYCPNEVEDKTDYEVLAKMQHYGLPTRLLDITRDKYVALFMACTNIFGDANSINDIGEVIAFESPKTVRKNSKQVQEIASFACGKIDATAKNMEEKIKGSYFIEYGKIKDNKRMELQKGSFIIFGTQASIDTPYSSFLILDKKRLLRELNELGYNEMKLVPELEHICHHIKQQCLIS